MKRFVLLCSALLLCVITSQSQQPTGVEVQTPPPDVLYNNALRDFTSARYQLAAQEFLDYLRFYPASDKAGNAQFYLGDISYRQGNFEQAVREYDKVLERYPGNHKAVFAQLKKGYALAELGQKEAAVNELQDLLARYPRSPEATQARQRLRNLGASTTAREKPLTLTAPSSQVSPAPAQSDVAKPPPPTLALSLQPANVQVYVDDIFKGMTSAEGRLVVEGLSPGSHRVRMNLIGYTESARTVELKPGETATIEAKLEPAGPKPLALAEIEEVLSNGLPPKGITKLVNQYGVDFTLTKPIEQRLREKGADSDLLVAIATNKK